MSVRDDLKAYLDGELSPLRMAEVREAIDRDPVLAQELAELESLSVAIRGHASSPVVVGFEDTLKALGRTRKPKTSWIGLPLALAGAGALVLAILFPVFSTAKQSAKRSSLAKMASGEAAAAGSAGRVAMESSAKEQAGLPAMRPQRQDYSRIAETAAKASDSSDAAVEAASPRIGKKMSRDLAKAEPQGARVPLHVLDEQPSLKLGTGKTRVQSDDSTNLLKASAAPPVNRPVKVPVKVPVKAPAKPPLAAGTPLSDALSSQPTRDVVGALKAPSAVAGELADVEPIVIEVDSVAQAQARLQALALRLEGKLQFDSDKVESLSFTKPGGGRPEGEGPRFEEVERKIVLDVPENRAAEAVREVRRVAAEPAVAKRSLAASNRGAPTEPKTSSPPPAGGFGGGTLSSGFGGAGGLANREERPLPAAPTSTRGGPPERGRSATPVRRKIVIVIRKKLPDAKAPADKDAGGKSKPPSTEGSDAGNL